MAVTTDDAKQPVSFSRADARRIAAVVRRDEHRHRNPPPPRGRYPIGGGDGGQVAVVKTTVGARSGSLAGVGTVTLKLLDESTGNYVDGPDDVPVKNPYATSLAVGTWVTLVLASGGWTIFGADCA